LINRGSTAAACLNIAITVTTTIKRAAQNNIILSLQTTVRRKTMKRALPCRSTHERVSTLPDNGENNDLEPAGASPPM
jgi:hypothetical protein